MIMLTWLVAVLGSGGALGGLFALIKYRMTLGFYRDMAQQFGLEGLDAASRATHPQLPASRRRKPSLGIRRAAPPTPPPTEGDPPAPAPPRAVS